jgi:hypothetical protein
VSVLEEKLAGVDQALAALGKTDEEISEVPGRFAHAEPIELQAADDELASLGEGLSVELAASSARVAEAFAPEAVEDSWDDENTEIEIIDESDFVLLVDEDDLDELEKVGEDDALRTAPPALPGEGEEGEEGEEGDGFFKKLFSGRRTSNRPQ